MNIFPIPSTQDKSFINTIYFKCNITSVNISITTEYLKLNIIIVKIIIVWDRLV